MVSRETDDRPPLTSADVAATLGLSDEVRQRLEIYAETLRKWQSRINLVSGNTLPELWRRHILDSAQLHRHLPPGPLLDLGSGAGFPGLVLAILDAGSGRAVHLVEVDQRKCAFLREAARLTGASVTIHTSRIERLEAFAAGVITSRALAPLSDLLHFSEKFLSPATHCLFLKGRGSDEELTALGKDWMMRLERIPSLADPSGLILHLSEVHRGRDES